MITVGLFVHREPPRNKKIRRMYRQIRSYAKQSAFIAFWVVLVNENSKETTALWDTLDDDLHPFAHVPFNICTVNDIRRRISSTLPSTFEGHFLDVAEYAARRGALWEKRKCDVHVHHSPSINESPVRLLRESTISMTHIMDEAVGYSPEEVSHVQYSKQSTN